MRRIYLLVVLILIFIFILIYMMVSNKVNVMNNRQKVTSGNELNILTNSLIQAKKDNNMQEMVKIASERKDVLIKKLPDNPQAFLTDATLSKQRSEFPEQVRPLIEENVELEGRLVVVISDDFENKKSKTDYFLESSGNRFSLHFAKNAPELLSGTQILVKGIKLGNNIVLDLK